MSRTTRFLSFVFAVAASLAIGIVAGVRMYRAAADGTDIERARGAASDSNLHAVLPPAANPTTIPAAHVPERDDALTRFGRMARERAHARDLRVFVESAKRRPEDGGVAYAIDTLVMCQGLSELATSAARRQREMAQGPADLLAARLNALERLTHRCAGFTREELSRDPPELWKSAATSDPLLAWRSRRSQATRDRDYGQRRQLAIELFEMRDPLLLASGLASVVGVYEQGKAVVYLDGRRFGGLAAEDFWSAVGLLECSFGVPCDESDIYVLHACALEGACFSDRIELYRQQMFRDAPATFEAILRVRDRLVDAIRRGDIDAFKPPPSGG
jgi:hypothetical protein